MYSSCNPIYSIRQIEENYFEKYFYNFYSFKMNTYSEECLFKKKNLARIVSKLHKKCTIYFKKLKELN